MPTDRQERLKSSNSGLFIPLRLQAGYRENLDYNDPVQKNLIPKEFEAVEDLIAAGGRVEYGPGPGCFQRSLSALVAFCLAETEVTPELEPYFVDQVPDLGIRLCVCKMRFFKTAYTSAGKTILSDFVRIMSRSKNGSLDSMYQIRNERKQTQSGNIIWVPPVQRQREATPSEIVEKIKEIYS
jgi:hypothetical protein